MFVKVSTELSILKNSILTKKLEKNVIAQVKWGFRTILEIFDRFKRFQIKIVSAVSIAPKFFSFQLFPLAYCCK